MFYDNFKRLCNINGTTPTQLLNQLGIGASKGTHWKNGSMPREDVMNTLADALGCGVYDFFIDEPSFHIPSIQDKDEQLILDTYRSFDRRKQIKLLNFLIDIEKEAL